MRTITLLLAALIVAWNWSVAIAADAPKETPAATRPDPLKGLPEAVRKTALKEAGDHKIHGIEKEMKKDKMTYAVEWMDGKNEVEVWIAEDGTVVDRASKEIVPRPATPTREQMRKDMAKVCDLSDEQAKKIAAIDSAFDKASADWETKNGPALKEAQMKLLKLVMSQKKEGALEAAENMQKLQAAHQEIVEKAGADVLGAMKPDQQAKWQEHAALTSIDTWFDRAKLTDEQKAAVKAAYAELAKAKDAKMDDILVALGQKTFDMLTDKQLAGLRPFMMHTEWSFNLSASQPATTGPVQQKANLSDGMLTLGAEKIAKAHVVILSGGYPGIMGGGTAKGTSMVEPD